MKLQAGGGDNSLGSLKFDLGKKTSDFWWAGESRPSVTLEEYRG
jgi:hypothetical protein